MAILENGLVLIAIVIYLLPWAALITGLVVLIKWIKKKRKKEK